MDTSTTIIPPLPQGFRLYNQESKIPPLPEGFRVELEKDSEKVNTLKSIFPDIPEENWVAKGVQETGKDVLAIPAHFFNQLLMNYPRDITEKVGYKYPEETKTKVAGIAAKTAGVVGAIKNPLFKLMGITPASGTIAKSVAGGIYAGGYSQPNKDRLKSAVIGATIPLGGKVISKGTQLILKASRATSARIINSLVKPMLKDFSYGKNPGLGVAREGIIANNMDELAQKISKKQNELGKQIGSITKSSNKMVNVRGILKPINIALIKAKRTPETNSTLITRLEGLKSDLTGVIGGKEMQLMKVDVASKTKILIGDLTKWTGNASDDAIVNKSLKMVYSRLRNRIENVIPEIKGLNERYANLTSAKIATIYRDKIMQRQNMVGLAPKVAGYGGLLYGIGTGNPTVIMASIGEIGLDKILSSPMAKTRLASALYKMSELDKNKIFQAYPKLESALTTLMQKPYFSNAIQKGQSKIQQP